MTQPAPAASPGIAPSPLPGGGFLRPSPEHHHKKLLADGAERIFEIGPVFRSGDQGRWHAPQFSMLEWYRVGAELEDLLAESRALVQMVLGSHSFVCRDYYAFMSQKFGVDLYSEPDRAKEIALAQGCPPVARLPEDDAYWLDYLMSRAIEGEKGHWALRNWPVQTLELEAVTPQKSQEDRLLSDRFEYFVGEVELINACRELTDGTGYLKRVELANVRRTALGLPEVEKDLGLAQSLDRLPDCSGAAMGLERLCMLATNASNISVFIP